MPRPPHAHESPDLGPACAFGSGGWCLGKGHRGSGSNRLIKGLGLRGLGFRGLGIREFGWLRGCVVLTGFVYVGTSSEFHSSVRGDDLADLPAKPLRLERNSLVLSRGGMDPYDSPLRSPRVVPKNPFLHFLLGTSQRTKYKRSCLIKKQLLSPALQALSLLAALQALRLMIKILHYPS